MKLAMKKSVYQISKPPLKVFFSTTKLLDPKIDTKDVQIIKDMVLDNDNLDSTPKKLYKVASKINFLSRFYTVPKEYNKLTNNELMDLIYSNNIKEYIEMIEFCCNDSVQHKEIIKQIDLHISKLNDLEMNISEAFKLLEGLRKCYEGYMIRPLTFQNIAKKLVKSRNWLNNEYEVKSMVKTTIFFNCPNFEILMLLEKKMAKYRYCTEMVELAHFISQYYPIRLNIHDIILNHMRDDDEIVKDKYILKDIKLTLKMFRVFDFINTDYSLYDDNMNNLVGRYVYLDDEVFKNDDSNFIAEDLIHMEDTRMFNTYEDDYNTRNNNSENKAILDMITMKFNKLLYYLFEKKMYLFKDKVKPYHFLIIAMQSYSDFNLKYKKLLNIVTFYTDKFILYQLKNDMYQMCMEDYQKMEDIIQFHVNVSRISIVNRNILDNFEDFKSENLIKLLKLYKKFNFEIHSDHGFFVNLVKCVERAKQNEVWMAENHTKLEELMQCLDSFNVNLNINDSHNEIKKKIKQSSK